MLWKTILDHSKTSGIHLAAIAFSERGTRPWPIYWPFTARRRPPIIANDHDDHLHYILTFASYFTPGVNHSQTLSDFLSGFPLLTKTSLSQHIIFFGNDGFCVKLNKRYVKQNFISFPQSWPEEKWNWVKSVGVEKWARTLAKGPPGKSLLG